MLSGLFALPFPFSGPTASPIPPFPTTHDTHKTSAAPGSPNVHSLPSRESRHSPQLTALATIEACASARLSYFSPPPLARPRRLATRPAARPPQIHSLAAHTAPRSGIPRGSPATSGSPSAVSSESAATPPARSPTSASWPRRSHIASAANQEPPPRTRVLSIMGLRRPQGQSRPLRPALPLGPHPRRRLRVARRQPHPLHGRYGRTT